MITLDKFNNIKDKYGYYASWAIWANQGERPKSNIGDLSVLDPAINETLLPILNPNVVFVGLNISKGEIKTPLANFHSSYSRATDFKIRFAFKDSPFWGGYMTDIIKGLEEINSGKVEKFLRENEEIEQQNVDRFRQELLDIGASEPTLIAFGNAAFKVLKRNLKNEFNILKIYHYAHFMNKEDYRAHVWRVCKF